METFSFIKFWRFTGKTRRETKRCDPIIRSSTALLNDEGADEGDDSFFDLELSFTDFNSKNRRESKKPDEYKTELAVPPSTIDHVSKKEVGHGDPVAKPHSPIALLKTGSKFRAFSSKKSMEGTETPTRTECARGRSLDVRFKIDEGKESSASFPRETSFRITAGSLRSLSIDDMLSEDFSSSSSYSLSSSSSSKRFFNSLIRPLYTKSAKTQSSKKDNHVSSVASPASSPAAVVGREKQRNLPTGIWVVRKHLGKSRSASAAVGATSPASRVDDSLIVQQDGIQSAILHCKRSFHGSTESSMLSRSTSDSSSQEKISTSSSEDSYAFSRISSCSASERSTVYEKIDES